jgi:hypothetical protein
MRPFRLLGATTVATIAAAYVPPHMELPANGIWADIGAGSVRSFRSAHGGKRRGVSFSQYFICLILLVCFFAR